MKNNDALNYFKENSIYIDYREHGIIGEFISLKTFEKFLSEFGNENKDKVFDVVNKWMVENECHSGEHAAQNDECNINSIDLVCELADIVGVPYPDDF